MVSRMKLITLLVCLLSLLALSARPQEKKRRNRLSFPLGNPPPSLESGAGTRVKITESDPILEGGERCKVFRYGAVSNGTVFVEIQNKTFNWRVSLTDIDGRLLCSASGGIESRSSSIETAMKAGKEIRIFVIAMTPGEEGALTLTVREENRSAGEKAVGEATRRAKDLLDRAKKEKDPGDPSKAAGFVRAALAVMNDEPGCRQSGKAMEVYWDIGILSDDLKDYAASRVAYTAVARFRESTLPRDDELLTRSRILLALACEKRGDMESARCLYKKIVDDLERTRPPDYDYLQQARLSLAILLDPKEGLPILEKVVKTYERSPHRRSIDLLFARMKLTKALKAVGRLDDAMDQGKKHLEACESLFPPEHPVVEEAGVLMAGIHQARGNLFQAKRLLEKVLATRKKKASPGNDPILPEIWNALAKIHSALGDFPEAVSYYEKVLDYRERSLPSDDDDLQRSRMNLAAAKANMGDIHGALPLLEKAARVWRRTLEPGHHNWLAASCNLAVVLKQTGRRAEAKALLEGVLEEAEECLPPGHENLQYLRLNLAWILKDLEEYEAAGKLLEKVVAVLEQTKGPDDNDLQLARMNLAGNMIDRGLPDEGLALLEKAGAVWERTLPATSRELEALRLNLGQAYMLLGRKDEALKETGKALKGCGEFLSRAVRTGSLREIGESARRSRKVLDLSLTLSMKGLFPPEKCFAAVEKFKALGVRTGLVRRIMARRGGEEVERLWENLAAASFRVASAKGDDFEKAVRARDRAERLLAKEIAALPGARKTMASVDAGDIGAVLPEGWIGISFVRFNSTKLTNERLEKTRTAASYAAFIVNRRGKVLQVDLGPAGPIDEAVEAWRGMLRRRGTSEKEREIGERLEDLLWKPLETGLGSARKVIVAPDSVLATVPLEALPQKNGFLLESYDFAYIDSLSTLAVAPRNVREWNTDLVAFGGVDYDAKPGLYGENPPTGGKDSAEARLPAGWALSHLSPRRSRDAKAAFLPGTVVESTAVASLYRRITGERVLLIQGPLASKASLIAYARKARYLHIATHGYFAGEEVKSAIDPKQGNGNGYSPTRTDYVIGLAPSLLCGLKLAGCNRKRPGPGDDGVITAEEIQGLDLSGCRLAVLSACESNAGLVRSGEGIMSLQRALGVAGVRGSITSLWKIDDEAARLFFTAFYRLLWEEGMSPVEALRRVKRDMIRGRILPEMEGARRGPGKPHRINTPKDYSDPFFWAAFVYWGRIG